jgi:hypothetical protein
MAELPVIRLPSSNATLKELYCSITQCVKRLRHCNYEVPNALTGFSTTRKIFLCHI